MGAILPTMRVPTLVMHCTGDRYVSIDHGREVASLIPGARFIEYPGEDNYGWVARVMACADAGEVLTSSTVKDLVAGSGLRFSDRGIHELKGVPDEWHLYALER
jgi:hypothetical protein